MDVGEHSPLRDGHVRQQLVELLVVANCQLDVAGGDALLLVVAASVPGELQDLSAEVLWVRFCRSFRFRIGVSGCVIADDVIYCLYCMMVCRYRMQERYIHAESRSPFFFLRVEIGTNTHRAARAPNVSKTKNVRKHARFNIVGTAKAANTTTDAQGEA